MLSLFRKAIRSFDSTFTLIDSKVRDPGIDPLPPWRQVLGVLAWLAMFAVLQIPALIVLAIGVGFLYLVAQLLGTDLELAALLVLGPLSFAALVWLGMKLELGLTYFVSLSGAYAVIGVVIATNKIGYALLALFVAGVIYSLVQTVRKDGPSIVRSLRESLAILMDRPLAPGPPSATAGPAHMEAPHEVSRRAWLHGEARCPNCGLHLHPHRELVEYIRVNSETRATGAIATHRRCGATFRIVFTND